MAQQASASPTGTASPPSRLGVTQEATQEGRAESLWRLQHLLDALEAQIEQDCAVAIREENEAAKAYKEATERRKMLMDAHPSMVDVKAAQEQIALLKAQFLQNHRPGDPKTLALPSGDKVQVRATAGVTITDSRKLAQVLIAKDLWEVAKVSLKADEKLLVPLVENGVLTGAATTEDKLSLSMIARKG